MSDDKSMTKPAHGSLRRVVGIVCVLVGLLLAINALAAGPHAFGFGIKAVVAMCLAGAAVCLCGIWLIFRKKPSG